MPREPLILLPGMMCDERLFAPQIDAFAEHYDVCVPRLEASSIDEMARHVLSAIPNGPLNVMGLSMGGIVAMAMTAIAPERIVRLALLDTNHRADAAGRYDVRNRQIADVQAGKLRNVIIDEMKPIYLAKEHQHNQELLNLLVEMAMDIGAKTFVAQSLALRDRPDQTESLRAFKGPTIVICGEEDRLCPPAVHQEMADLIADAQLMFVPSAGHISTLENPDAVIAAMQNWLSRRPAHAN